MRKKKVTKKSSKKSSPGNPNKSKERFALTLWKQIAGKFTYELVDPKTKSRYVCQGEHEMAEPELNVHLTLCVLLRDKPMKPGEEWKISEVWRPMDVVSALLKCPACVPEAKLAVMAVATRATPMTMDELNEVFRLINPRKRATPPKGVCPQCFGRGWVCEDHPDMPIGCPCMAPGMACETCNGRNEIRVGPADIVIDSDSCPRCYDRRWLCSKHQKPWKLPDFGCACSLGKPCPECNVYGQLKPGERTIPGVGLN